MKYYQPHKTGISKDSDTGREGCLKSGVYRHISILNRWGWTSYLSTWGYGVIICGPNLSDGFYLVRGERHRNRSLEGDRVRFEVDYETLEWTEPGARVKSVVWDKWLSVTGCLGVAKVVGIDRDDKDINMVGIVEVESRQKLGVNKRGVPYYRFKSDRVGDPPVRVASRQNTKNFYATVRLDSWTVDDRIPDGHIERELGLVGTDEGERAFLCARHGLLRKGWKALTRGKQGGLTELTRLIRLAEIDKDDTTDKKSDTECSDSCVDRTSPRLDLTHLPVFSIDPEGSRDLDDALHCVEITKSNQCGKSNHYDSTSSDREWMVGIHIADVTSLYPWESSLDLEARKRATSLYLDEDYSDGSNRGNNGMLPPEIANHTASLLEGKKRRALSLLIRVIKDEDCQEKTQSFSIKSVRLTRTWIKSIAAYSYERVEKLDIRDSVLTQIKDLEQMGEIFTLVGGSSRPSGSPIGSPNGSPNGSPSGQDSSAFTQKTPTMIDSHGLIERMMLWANHWVASFMNDRWGWGVFRIGSHWGDKDKDREDPKQGIVSSLDNSTRQFLEIYRRESASYGVTQSKDNSTTEMMYCHFTSPIRRYADGIVHRLLTGDLNPLDTGICGITDNILTSINTLCQASTRLHREWNLWKWIRSDDRCSDGIKSRAFNTRGLVVEIDPESMTLSCYIREIGSIVKVAPYKREWEDYCQCVFVDDSTLQVSWDDWDSTGGSPENPVSPGLPGMFEIKTHQWVNLVVAVFPERPWREKIVSGLLDN